MSLSDDDTYVTLEQAAALSGIALDRLASLARRSQMIYRGSQRDPLISISTLRTLMEAGENFNKADLLVSRLSRTRRTSPAPSFSANRVVVGNALDVIADVPDQTVQAVVTSPPFWGQRVYDDETPVKWRDGSEEPFGREASPEAYVRHTLEILSALHRTLRQRGTVWWNLGDSYMTRTIARTSSHDRIRHYGGERTAWAGNPYRRWSSRHEYLKDKDLTLVPFQVAIGAQRLGFWVRSVIVWSKQREDDGDHGQVERRLHMPEVVGDRPVVGHEYVLLLTKSSRYDYHGTQAGDVNGDGTRLNVRSVWKLRPTNGPSNHGARFPLELPQRCIQLSTKPLQLVFDPFAGSGNTLIAAQNLNRRYFGCDISPTYVREAQQALAELEAARKAAAKVKSKTRR